MAKPPSLSIKRVCKGEPAYPGNLLRHPQEKPPSAIYLLGNHDLLSRSSTALFCSVKCPGDLIIKTYDLACALRDAGRLLIGGFHSPMEKECLDLLLRGIQPIIICLARSLDTVRLPKAWRKPIADERRG